MRNDDKRSATVQWQSETERKRKRKRERYNEQGRAYEKAALIHTASQCPCGFFPAS